MPLYILQTVSSSRSLGFVAQYAMRCATLQILQRGASHCILFKQKLANDWMKRSVLCLSFISSPNPEESTPGIQKTSASKIPRADYQLMNQLRKNSNIFSTSKFEDFCDICFIRIFTHLRWTLSNEEEFGSRPVLLQ